MVVIQKISARVGRVVLCVPGEYNKGTGQLLVEPVAGRHTIDRHRLLANG